MMKDIEAGRVNCVVVKDLSRFGRDYIEAGRYLEKIFPVLGVRFIALTDHYDSISADTGERQIVIPVKNFINDSYCRDISTKVKSQLAVKRKAGECLSPFAVYGYRKSPENKNKLVVDDYAAEIVRRIFRWKIEGMAVSAIAKKLNELHILSPKEYKKSTGLNYRGGFTGGSGSQWSSSSVKRILTNEVYLGHLLQGKTEKVNYKVKKSVEKPKEEWVRAEVEKGASSVVRSATFAVFIILIVFFPILTLTGIEGKYFTPMAKTLVFCIIGALFLSLTYVPMMASLFLKHHIVTKPTFADKFFEALTLVFCLSL